MLNAVMKKLGISPDVQKEEVDMSTQDRVAVVELAQHEAIVAQLADVQASVQSLTEQLQAAQTALAAAEAYNAEMAAQAQAKVQADRIAKVQAILGTDKAATAMATMENFDEATFDQVLGMMATTYEAESKSALFSEAGVAAEAAAPEEKDAVQRLADNIAAQFKNT